MLAGIKMRMPYTPLKGHKDIRQYLYRTKIHCAWEKKTRKISCFGIYALCFWGQSGVAINRGATGSHRWVKLTELNFLKTKTFLRSSNQVSNTILTFSQFAWCPALNRLTPVLPVTARDEPWPFFHFWCHHFWPNLASLGGMPIVLGTFTSSL